MTGSGIALRRWLREEMLADGCSQRELALRSGVDHSAISRILAGDRAPRYDTVVRLANALGFAVVLVKRGGRK